MAVRLAISAALLIGCGPARPAAPQLGTQPPVAPPPVTHEAPAAGEAPGAGEAPAAGKAATPEAAAAGPICEPPPEIADTLVPCLPGTPAHAEAEAALRALDALINALGPADDPAPANQALCRLLAHECLAVGRALHDEPEALVADSAAAMKAFWSAGGQAWLSDAIDLHDGETLSVPSSMLPTLALDLLPAHPLAPMLCARGDAACGAETRGWLARAAQAFESFAGRRPHDFAAVDGPDEEACAKEARAAEPGAALETWYQCASRLDQRDALPHGVFRVPDQGWLVVSGRRGHYAFCDGIAAYDLATGAAYMSGSCSKLALITGGAVDHYRTDGARRARAVSGRLPLDNLREAALMILLVDEATRNVRTRGRYALIPEGIERRLDALRTGSASGTYMHSSAQTRLAWVYVRDGAIVKTGDLTWPYDYNEAARQHAVSLLDIAERGLAQGCAPAPLPADLPLATTPQGVSRLDADPERLHGVNRELADALRGLVGRACPDPR